MLTVAATPTLIAVRLLGAGAGTNWTAVAAIAATVVVAIAGFVVQDRQRRQQAMEARALARDAVETARAERVRSEQVEVLSRFARIVGEMEIRQDNVAACEESREEARSRGGEMGIVAAEALVADATAKLLGVHVESRKVVAELGLLVSLDIEVLGGQWLVSVTNRADDIFEKHRAFVDEVSRYWDDQL